MINDNYENNKLNIIITELYKKNKVKVNEGKKVRQTVTAKYI